MIKPLKKIIRSFIDIIKSYSRKKQIKKINYKNQGIINFIDVGSIDGLPEPWNHQAKLIKLLLNFEPNDEPIRGKNFMTYNYALWEKAEIKPFYIYKGFNHTGSSLFKQNYEYVEKEFESLKKRGPSNLAETWFERSELVRTTELTCKPLDEIVKSQFPKSDFHFLKIDAQGAEFNILKGAESLLNGSCCGLHLELFTIPLYKGIVLLNEVVDYLSRFDFELVKKFPPHGTFDSQHDCLFIKKSGDPLIVNIIKETYRINESSN